jgi:hypothetical protein
MVFSVFCHFIPNSFKIIFTTICHSVPYMLCAVSCMYGSQMYHKSRTCFEARFLFSLCYYILLSRMWLLKEKCPGVIIHTLSCIGLPLWSSGQSSWLQIRRLGFDSQHYQGKKCSGSGTGSTQPRTTEELLDRKVAAPV